jgi:glycosyltransferase involved in cell wall biosynthesis
MAENYPGLLRTRWETGVAKPFDILVRNPWLASLVERWVLHKVDAVICVIEESASRVRSLGVPERNVTVVRNTPLLESATDRVPRRTGNDGRLVIAYLGIVERHRGIHELVQAVAECRRRHWPVELLVIGSGIGYSDVQALATELGVLDHGVRFLGRMENDRALEVVATADVGAIPHIPCDAWNTTIPNKLFDYMSLGLPVLTSNVVPVQRIVLEAGCGVSYTSGDIASLLSAIEVLRSSEVREKMGNAGIQAVQAKYNWTVDARQLDAALGRIVNVREGA